MSHAARLLFPALRWADDNGFEAERDLIETSLALGVGGFCLFGGTWEGVRELTSELQRRSRHTLLIASDLERGAGQQFRGATRLPPLAALGRLDDLSVTRRAAALTAQEALAVGVNWIFAPVADIDLEPANPIVGTRAFGTDADHVSAHVTAWIEGARSVGALCCAKHFPGHGRTTEDSHAALPRVRHDRTALEVDLAPFRAATAAGVDAMMTAHVTYDALDPRTPATLSAPILQDLLRDEIGFNGLIVSDSLVMDGLQIATENNELNAAVAALNAGCDILLYPGDVAALADHLDGAGRAQVSDGRIEAALARLSAAAERVATAAERVNTAAERTAAGAGNAGAAAADSSWADEIAERCCIAVRGQPAAARAVDLLTIDDDEGGPFPPPPRTAFPEALTAAGVTVHDWQSARGSSAERPLIVAIYADVRAWKGTAAMSDRAAARLDEALSARADADVVYFGHPRITESLTARNILAAWGGESLMQRAAVRWLTRGLQHG